MHYEKEMTPELEKAMDKYYYRFHHRADAECEINFNAFSNDKFLYYINKCLETGINMTDYLDKHSGEYERKQNKNRK